MAQPVSVNDYGWFTPADLEVLFRVIHQLETAQSIILIGGQALTTWVQYYAIDLPPIIDTPYLTQDADFLGPGNIAALVAQKLPNGVARKPEMGDSTPNTATVVFVGAAGEKILIDFLQNVLGIADKVVNDLAITISINDWAPIKVLHPILVLQSRCINLQKLESKRDANGLTQVKVACEVVEKYLADCLNDPSRRREALKAAKRIVQIARSQPGVFVWTERGGLGFSDGSESGMTAIFFNDSRSIPDETTETQPLTGLQGEGGFGSLERREDDRAACCAL